jgi:hypothetical protein
MDKDKIMRALRQLSEAVNDSDGRSDQAMQVVDYTSSRLSQIYGYDFREGGHVFEARLPQRLSKVEVVFLDEHQGWDSMVVEIPEDVAETQSQDAFIKWVYSDEGERFRKTWHKGVMSVYVMSWRDDLDASGHPAVADDNEPDVLYGRGDMEQWSRYERNDDETTAAFAVFQVWEQGERNIFAGMENTALYTQREAEGHLEVLIKRADPAHDFEIASLRKVLGKT